MDNRVEIVVGARDMTRADLDDLRRRLDEFGKKVATAKINVDDKAASASLLRMADQLRRLDKRVTPEIDLKGFARAELQLAVLERSFDRLGGGGGGGGFFSRLGGWLNPLSGWGKIFAGFSGGFMAGIAGMASSGSQGVAVLAALTAAVGALLAALAPVVAALIPVTLGFGALAAVVMPVVSNLKTGLTTLSQATDNYQQASQNLNVAIHKSKADWQAYQATIHGLEPDFQRAARLLTDQNVTWQSLTPSQRKSVVALYDNSAAYKALLPDQKAALSALLQQKAAWDQLTPAQQKLSTALSGLGAQWHKAAQSVQPEIYKAFATSLDIIKRLMPALEPLLKAAANALDNFLKSMDNWLKSPSGQAFVHWLQTQGPKDIAMFGRVVWDTAVAVGIALDHIYRAGLWVEQHLKTFFTVDIPASFDIFKEVVRIAFDNLKLAAMEAYLSVTTTFGHLPGPLGAPFRSMSDTVRKSMANVRADMNQATDNIINDIQRIHGKTVAVNVDLGVPSQGKINAINRGYATGTSGALPGWAWVGERGPEIVKMAGGETVIPNHVLTGYAGGAGLDFTDKFHPSVRSFLSTVNSDVSQVENAIARGVQKAFARIVPRGGGSTSAGGQYNLFNLESLWERVGGPGGYTAHVAGAIALAESGGNPNAYNPSGASGLWQILGQVYPGNIFNPVINAINALTKYVDAGGFSPWVTYETGAYLQYMARGGRARPGLAMVGERGPELVGRGGIPVTLEVVSGGGGQFEQMFAEMIRRYVRVRGGSVQKVFGRN